MQISTKGNGNLVRVDRVRVIRVRVNGGYAVPPILQWNGSLMAVTSN